MSDIITKIKKNDIEDNITKFSTPDNYLFFRVLRFPNFLNPYSLTSETFAQSELRKITRQVGKPTRIYPSSLKDGNLKRSVTLMKPSQRIFGSIGYALSAKNVNDITYFSSNMDSTVSGYGKFKNYLNFNKESHEVLKKQLDDFCQTPVTNQNVNETIMDISKLKDISFIFYSLDRSTIFDQNGLESSDKKIRQLSALYLKKEFQNTCGIDLPIYEYSVKGIWLKNVEFPPKAVKRLLAYNLKTSNNNRNLIPIITTFEKEIKESNHLLKLANSLLSQQFMSYRFGFYTTKYDNSHSLCKHFINQEIFRVNCFLSLAKCLKTYSKYKQSQYIAKKTLTEVLNQYANGKHNIYDVRENCTHSDIHLRTFTNLIEATRELLPPQEFNKYLNKISKTFENVCKISKEKGKSVNLYVASYLDNYPYLKTPNISNSLDKNPIRNSLKRFFFCGHGF